MGLVVAVIAVALDNYCVEGGIDFCHFLLSIGYIGCCNDEAVNSRLTGEFPLPWFPPVVPVSGFIGSFSFISPSFSEQDEHRSIADNIKIFILILKSYHQVLKGCFKYAKLPIYPCPAPTIISVSPYCFSEKMTYHTVNKKKVYDTPKF